MTTKRILITIFNVAMLLITIAYAALSLCGILVIIGVFPVEGQQPGLLPLIVFTAIPAAMVIITPWLASIFTGAINDYWK